MEVSSENTKTEYDSDDGVRHTCYSLLQGISFGGEPVVPRIIQPQETIEHEGKVLGKSFEVENLDGIDLSDFVADANIGLKDKLFVLKYVVGQLKAIDEAGYIIFDRHGDNIRVLKHGENGISIRQMDLEDIYIKEEDRFIGNNSKSWEKTAESLKQKGLSMWIVATWRVANEGRIAAEVGGREDIAKELEKFSSRDRDSMRKRNLQNLEKLFDDAIKEIQ